MFRKTFLISHVILYQINPYPSNHVHIMCVHILRYMYIFSQCTVYLVHENESFSSTPIIYVQKYVQKQNPIDRFFSDPSLFWE